MSTDPMAEIRASFFVECEELMESLQDALVILDEDGGDAETINVVFRAVHSIKGGAGAFGFDALVGFAHRFETVLDQLRAGKLALTPEATRLFIQGADLVHDHIRAAQSDSAPPTGAEDVLKALEALMGDAAPDEDEAVDFTPATLGFSLDLPGLDELKGAGLFDGRLPKGFGIPQPDDSEALKDDEEPLDDDGAEDFPPLEMNLEEDADDAASAPETGEHDPDEQG